MKSAVIKFLSALIFNTRILAAVTAILCVVISLQHYLYTPPSGSVDALHHYTHFNDYLIFKFSFEHLIHHRNLYITYSNEYFDLFKYTPTFALLMAPFPLLSNIAGIILWDILNAAVMFFAIRRFPFATREKALFTFSFVIIEAITSLQNFECNCLMTGLFLWAFIAAENKKTGLATFLIMLSAFIKPFGLAFFVLFIFYPQKLKAITYSAAWFLILLALPLVVVSVSELGGIYRDWGALLLNDHATASGFSVMGWLKTWFAIDEKFPVLIGGVILFLLPLLRIKSFTSKKFRILFLSSSLIWVIIFNHLAESPTYIIAITGVAIWYAHSKPASAINRALLILCFLFSVLASTSFYPSFIRHNYFIPYVVKAVPCILIWIKILYDLLTTDFSSDLSPSVLQKL